MTTSPRPLSAETVTMPGWDWRQLAACRHAGPNCSSLLCVGSVPGSGHAGEGHLRRLPRPPATPGLRTRQDHGVWGG